MSAALTRSRLERFDPAMFAKAADILRKQAQVAEGRSSGFAEGLVEQSNGRWTGTAADALHERGAGFERTHSKEEAVLLNGSSIADLTNQHLAEAKKKVLDKIAEVEGTPMFFQSEDGSRSIDCGDPFEVSEDFTVHVKPLPNVPWEIVRLLRARAGQLTEDVKALTGQFESLDAQLGQKIREAVDFSRLALDANGRPYTPYDGNKAANDAGQAIADGKMGVPSDPKQLHDLWDKLDKDHKEAIYDRYHDIGNHGGIPFDPPDHLGRDHYNQRHLGEIAGQKEHELHDLHDREPRYNPQGSKTFGEFEHEHEAWDAQRKNLQTEVDGYRSVRAALDHSKQDGIPRILEHIDDKGRAAVAVNNPDFAKKSVVLVPGTTVDMSQMKGYDSHSLDIHNSAMKAADGELHAGDVSVSTWLGYDRPMSVFNPFSDKWAGDPRFALEGARNLDDFMDGIRASHNDYAAGGPAYQTVIGHSYGTSEVGAAATHGNHLDANAVVSLASPGMFADNAHGLSLAPDAKMFVGKSFFDPIDAANAGSVLTGLAGDALNELGAPGVYSLGTDPSLWDDAYRIDAGSGGHSSYFDPNNPAMKNLGRIVIGEDGSSGVTPY